MLDNNNKGKCKCGKETFRKIKLANSSTFICNKCTKELAYYLLELSVIDSRDNEKYNDKFK